MILHKSFCNFRECHVLANFTIEVQHKAMQPVADSLYLYPGRVISEFLDPGLFELYHHSQAQYGPPPPFLYTSPVNMTIRTIHNPESQGQWIFWFILLGFAILTITRYYYLRRMKLLFSSIVKRSSSLQLLRDGPVYAHQSFILLLVIYVISVIILLHHVIEVFSPGFYEGMKSMKFYAEILGLYLAFFILKLLVIWLVSITFNNPETGSEYIQNIIIFNLVLGILILPLLLMMRFIAREVFVYMAVIIIILMMALRFIRGIVIGLSDTKFSLFHLFLYLCTLEILPAVIAAKFLSKYFFT